MILGKSPSLDAFERGGLDASASESSGKSAFGKLGFGEPVFGKSGLASLGFM